MINPITRNAMHGILLIVFLFFGYAKSSDFIKHLDPGDSSQKGSISYSNPHPIPSLRDIAFQALINYTQQKKIPYEVVDQLPKDLKDLSKKRLAGLYGAFWFELFGANYKPEVTVLEQEGTKISPDRRYLFVYGNNKTCVYQLNDIIPKKLSELAGEFHAVTIDSKFIMVTVEGGCDFYTLPALELFLHYEGPFNKKLDVLLVSEKAEIFLVEKSLACVGSEYIITQKDYETFNKHLNCYVFSTMDIAYKTELLFWGDSRGRSYAIPRSMLMVDNQPCALVRTEFEGQSAKYMGIYLFDFKNKEKIIVVPNICSTDERKSVLMEKVRAKSCTPVIAEEVVPYGVFSPLANTISNNGRFIAVASDCSASIFLFDISDLCRFKHEDLMTMQHLIAYSYNQDATNSAQQHISKLAVSNDGVKVISVADHAALKRQSSNGFDESPHVLGIDGDITDKDQVFVRLHFFNKKGSVYGTESSVLIKRVLKNNEVIRQVGFNEYGDKFFILSNKIYSIYTLSDLFPDRPCREMASMEPSIRKFTEMMYLTTEQREAESIRMQQVLSALLRPS